MKRRYRCLTLTCCWYVALFGAAGHAQVTALADAEQRLLRGNYQESNAAFTKLLKKIPVQATLGLARGHQEQGRLGQTIEQIKRQLKLSPGSAQLHAERAQIALYGGELETCREHIQLALTADQQSILAQWIQAELWRVEGKIVGEIDKACEAYRRLAELYDRQQKKIRSPRQLYWLGLSLAQHARFNQDKQRFRQLTTRLYPRLLSLEPNYWPAHYQSGLLLAEKFNSRDAETAFNDALQINPQAADAHVGLARLALDEFELDRARRHLDRALRTNPKHQGACSARAVG